MADSSNCLSGKVEGEIINWPKVVLFGDSLTQYCFDVSGGCWGALLANRLQRQCDVVSRGFSGYNTRWCKLILPRLYTKDNVGDVVCFVICLGANDCCLEASPQHVPITEYAKNLGDIVDYLQSIGIEKSEIILMTPPPYNIEVHRLHTLEVHDSEPLRDSAHAENYAKACASIAQSYGIDCVDLHHEIKKEENWKEYLNDGLHFSVKGAEAAFRLLWPLVEQRVRSLPWILPLYSDVDSENPEKSFQCI